MKEATLLCHRGLGDLIIISGAAACLSSAYDKFNFPCHSHHQVSVRSMFALHPKINVFVLTKTDVDGNMPIPAEAMRGDMLSVHWMLSGRFPDPALSRWENEYASLGLKYSARWDCCPISEAAKLVTQTPLPACPYAFVHDDTDRGFNILDKYISPGIKVIRPDQKTPNILSYCSLIENASEGHYIDSSFRHLAESVKPSGKLFYHEYARDALRGELDFPSRKKWVTIR